MNICTAFGLKNHHSALQIRARGPGFDSRVVPQCKLFTLIASAVSQLQESAVQKGVFGA